MHFHIQSLADLRGRQGRAPPLGSKFFHFHAVFDKKIGWHTHFGSWRPRKVLDPPLTSQIFFKYCSKGNSCYVITVRKRSCRKLMFSQVCVKNSVHREEVYTHTPGRHPLGRHTPLGSHPLGRHFWANTPAPPPQGRQLLQQTVRILLECNLVLNHLFSLLWLDLYCSLSVHHICNQWLWTCFPSHGL